MMFVSILLGLALFIIIYGRIRQAKHINETLLNLNKLNESADRFLMLTSTYAGNAPTYNLLLNRWNDFHRTSCPYCNKQFNCRHLSFRLRKSGLKIVKDPIDPNKKIICIRRHILGYGDVRLTYLDNIDILANGNM